MSNLKERLMILRNEQKSVILKLISGDHISGGIHEVGDDYFSLLIGDDVKRYYPYSNIAYVEPLISNQK